MIKHFGKTLNTRIGMVVLSCSGRAVQNLWAVTENPLEVTCKRCAAKIPPAPVPNMPGASA
jgi:hypothetical protein